MNSQLLERVNNERFMATMRGVLLFLGMVIVLSMLGLVFFAAA